MTNSEIYWKSEIVPLIRIGRLLCQLFYQGRTKELLLIYHLKCACASSAGLLNSGARPFGNCAEGDVLDALFGKIVLWDPEFFKLLAGIYRLGTENDRHMKNDFWCGPVVGPEEWESIDGVGGVRGKELLLYLAVGDQFARI